MLKSIETIKYACSQWTWLSILRLYIYLPTKSRKDCIMNVCRSLILFFLKKKNSCINKT